MSSEQKAAVAARDHPAACIGLQQLGNGSVRGMGVYMTDASTAPRQARFPSPATQPPCHHPLHTDTTLLPPPPVAASAPSTALHSGARS